MFNNNSLGLFWFLEQDVILLVRENGTFPYSIRGQFPSLAEDEYHLLGRGAEDGESDVPEEEEEGRKKKDQVIVANNNKRRTSHKRLRNMKKDGVLDGVSFEIVLSFGLCKGPM